MGRFTNSLNHVRIAAPCKADWDQMIGTDRVRFCGQCNLNVYNLSRMTRAQAESLIAGTEGRLCVRFYRRSDGSILTKDCPVGLRAIRRRLSYLAKAALAAVLSFLAGLGVYRFTELRSTSVMGVMAVIPEPITTPGVDTLVVTKQGQMVLRAEDVGKIPLGGVVKHQSTAVRKSRRKKGHAS